MSGSNRLKMQRKAKGKSPFSSAAAVHAPGRTKDAKEQKVVGKKAKRRIIRKADGGSLMDSFRSLIGAREPVDAARDAIARGAPYDAVSERLQQHGYDASGLGPRPAQVDPSIEAALSAISRGADRAAVIQRLRDRGIDSSGLD